METTTKLKTGPISVEQILKSYNSLWIPHFQRGLVWNDDDTSKLLESLFYERHCGTIILWQMDNGDSENYGLPLVANAKNNQGPQYLIIDGQQRIRSLYMIFNDCGEPGEENSDNSPNVDEEEGELAQRKLWSINLQKIPFLKEYYKPIAQKYKLFTKMTNPENKYNYIPLNELFKGKNEFVNYLNKKNNDKAKEHVTPTNPNYTVRREDLVKTVIDKLFPRIEKIKLNGDNAIPQFICLVLDYDQAKFDDLPQLYNRINSGGRKVEAEEKAFATLTSIDQKTSKYLKELFNDIHSYDGGASTDGADDRGNAKRDYLKRMKERSFGFKQFIRTFIQVCNYHFKNPLSSSAFSFSVVESEKFQEAICDKSIYNQLWNETKDVLIYLAGEEGVITNELKCDDFRFLPETKSLWPIIQLLIQFPDLRSEEKYRSLVASLILKLFLKDLSDKDILCLTIDICNEKFCHVAVKMIEEKCIDDAQKILTELKKANSTQNRYSLMLYWLLRYNGIRDFSYMYKNEEEKPISPGGKINTAISFKLAPEAQHIVPYARLKKIYPVLKDQKRLSKHEANNIGNITYISRQQNRDDEKGLWHNPISAKSEPRENLESHLLLGDNILKNYKEVITITDKMEAAKKKYEEFCYLRCDKIKEGFERWLEKLHQKTDGISFKKIEWRKPLYPVKEVMEVSKQMRELGLDELWDYVDTYYRRAGLELEIITSGPTYKFKNKNRFASIVMKESNREEGLLICLYKKGEEFDRGKNTVSKDDFLEVIEQASKELPIDYNEKCKGYVTIRIKDKQQCKVQNVLLASEI